MIRYFLKIFALFLICSLFVSCSNAGSIGVIGGADGPTSILVGNKIEKSADNIIEKLYSLKTEYVGDNSKVGNILFNADMLIGTPFDNFDRTFEITPSCGLIVNYKVDNRSNYRHIDEFYFDRSAAILFSLIGNLEEVHFRVFDDYSDVENADTSFYGCTYFIETLSERQLTSRFTEEYIRSAADTIEAFRDYMANVLGIAFPLEQKTHYTKMINTLGENEEIVVNSGMLFELTLTEDMLRTELADILPEDIAWEGYIGKALDFHIYAIRDFTTQATGERLFLFSEEELLGVWSFRDPKESYQARNILIELTEKGEN